MKNLLILFILLSFHLSAQKVDKKDEKTKSYNSIINNEVTTDQGLFVFIDYLISILLS